MGNTVLSFCLHKKLIFRHLLWWSWHKCSEQVDEMNSFQHSMSYRYDCNHTSRDVNRLQYIKVKVSWRLMRIAVCIWPHCYENSHAIWDHTALPTYPKIVTHSDANQARRTVTLFTRDTWAPCAHVAIQVSWRKVCLVHLGHLGHLAHLAHPAAAPMCHCGECWTIGDYWSCSYLKNKERSSHPVCNIAVTYCWSFSVLWFNCCSRQTTLVWD